MNELKDRLKEAREEKGFSQAELAKKAGVKNQSIIGSLETGYRQNSKYIPTIADVLGVEALWLTDGKLPKYKDYKKLDFDESFLMMIGLTSEQAKVDLIKDIQKFARETKENRARALLILEEEKTRGIEKAGKGNKGSNDK